MDGWTDGWTDGWKKKKVKNEKSGGADRKAHASSRA